MDEIGDIEFDKEKFKQTLHYIISQCGHLENIGKTVLYKILYFSDFDYYELYEENLTGEVYRKLPNGPAPVHFEEVMEELKAEGKINHFPVKSGDFIQQKFLSCKEPNLVLLSGKEIRTIGRVIAKCFSMNARQISAFSHEDMPYKATKDREIIDYEMVFYRNLLFSVREYGEDD